jgi:hypothetical protein
MPSAHSNIEELFAKLNDEADSSGLGLKQAPLDSEKRSPILLGDRLASLGLSGLAPLWMLVAAMAWGCLSWDQPGLMAGAALLVLPAAWLLAPLALTAHGLSLGRLALLSLFLMPWAAGSALATDLWARNLEGHPWHLELAASVLQDQLEDLLSGPSLALLGGLFIGVMGALSSLRARFPWVDVRPPAGASRALRLVTIGLAVLLSGGAIRSAFHLSQEEAAWQSDIAAVYRGLPYQALPVESDVSYWQDRRKTRSSEADFDFARHPITSRAELEAAETCLARVMGDISDSQGVENALSRIRLHLMKRPVDEWIYIDRTMQNEVLPVLAGNPLAGTEIKKLQREFRDLHALAHHGNRVLEADLVAYRLLWAQPEVLSHQNAPGWRFLHHGPTELKDPVTGKVVDTIKEPPPSYKGQKPDYFPVLEDRDFLIFGARLAWSPTRLMDKYLRLRLTREWVELRRSGENMEPRLEERCRQELERSTAGRFWDSLLRHNRVQEECRLFEVAELVLALRAYAHEHGRYPKELAAISNQLQLLQRLEMGSRLTLLAGSPKLHYGELVLALAPVKPK